MSSSEEASLSEGKGEFDSPGLLSKDLYRLKILSGSETTKSLGD